MYFRCTDCYAATWVQVTDPATATQTLKCRGCDRGFSVQTAGNFDGDASEQYETALALAEGNGFDLPTSYSVMLGIMTLEHAMTLQERGVPAQCTRISGMEQPDGCCPHRRSVAGRGFTGLVPRHAPSQVQYRLRAGPSFSATIRQPVDELHRQV